MHYQLHRILSTMKTLFITTTIILSSLVVRAQTNSSSDAQQAVNLGLTNVIDITFQSTSSATGGTITLPFNTVNDYADGVESTVQTVVVRSNIGFKIKVKTATQNFSVTNNGVTTTSTMPSTVLGLKVVDNNTGGTITNNFSTTSYTPLSSNSKIIKNGTAGDNNTLSVQYKATPGFEYPAGTYTIDVVFTAVQE